MTQEKLALPCLMLIMLLTMLARAPQQTCAQTVHGPNPYFAPYLQAGELPDSAVMPLFQEVWRIIGNDLDTTNFAAKVDQVSETIFAAYSYQGKATGSRVSDAAPTYVDGQLGELFVCTVILCKNASLSQQHACLPVDDQVTLVPVFKIAAKPFGVITAALPELTVPSYACNVSS